MTNHDGDLPRFAVSTGKGHRFRLGASTVQLQLVDSDHRPRPGVAYRLHVPLETEEVVLTGRTTSEGQLDEHHLPSTATRAFLELPDTGERWDVDLRGLPPLDAEGMAGVSARLWNLGYVGELHDDDDDALGAALAAFQADAREMGFGGVEVTGLADAPTLAALAEVHDDPTPAGMES